MNYLFFDCETTGKPKNYKASYSDVDNWPRVIQLAWILMDDRANTLQSKSFLIYPSGWKMPTDPFWIENGFTQDKNEAHGVPIEAVIDMFHNAVMRAESLVSHNIMFDHHVVWAEYIRVFRQPRIGIQKICTMQNGAQYIKSIGKYKWPKLQELYRALFNEDILGAHDAIVDVEACARCFFELSRLGFINLRKQVLT